MELACRNATEEPSEANLVKLLDLWSAGWKHRGRTRAVGPGAYERYATLGLFGHGGVVGVSNATGLREACIAVNRFLRTRFPDGTWSSIAVLFNPRMGLHRDIQNMPGHSNHALALGEYTGGRVWIEDDEGDSPAWLEDKKGGRELRGRWLDMHDKPVSFDARRYHKVEPHEGSMWALAAYVPQAYARATEQHRQACRGPHLYQMARPELAFDPSRRPEFWVKKRSSNHRKAKPLFNQLRLTRDNPGLTIGPAKARTGCAVCLMLGKLDN
ncbi:hypothetical protein AK812_SmicGene38759 [Symbiodinium microadriaticum]|uniref:Uncharacterized protein n=1 Tax=Symbiodinium microadriaticum TaxID=2951 RepID=A0A1Q9CCY1_SYMMI|nr:hypothetical protein AK812_SmicGene38759 [Symbiodinium microadriaticum]